MEINVAENLKSLNKTKENLIKEFIDNSDLDNNYTFNDFENWPKTLIVPDLSLFSLKKYNLEHMFTVNTIEQIKTRMFDIYLDRIIFFNNIIFSNWFGRQCDYCKVSMEDDFNCIQCQKDMCALCYTEENIQDAIKNGSSESKFLKRFPTIDFCKKNHQIEKIIVDYTKTINNLVNLASIIDEKHDNEILLDCNINSDTYQKVFIKNVDNHGRCSIFQTNLSLEELFQELNILEQQIQKEIKEHDGDFDGWLPFLNTPTKRFLENKNFPTHYG